MNDYVFLILLIVGLIIFYRFDKGNFKDFYEKNPYQKFNAVRVYIITIAIIIILIFKIIKS